MSVTRRQRHAIESLGFTVEERVDSYDWERDPEWQTLIKRDGKTEAVIATHGCHTDDDRLRNKYQLRRKGRPTQVFRLKRQALAAWASDLR